MTAIRDGDIDGNSKTEPGLRTGCRLSSRRAFPSYASAHASGQLRRRRVLERLYGKDGHDITSRHPAVPGVVLHYTAWEEITDDIDDARIYGGIHFRFDQEVGGRLGRDVATAVYKNNLGRVHDQD